jgi:hypothetical protein
MNNLKQIIAHCRLLIGEKTLTTDTEINSAISKVKILYPDIDEVTVKSKLAEIYSLQIEPFQILQGQARRMFWLSDFKANNPSVWLFWERYKSYLITREGYAPEVVRRLDELTDKILDNTFNPQLSNMQVCKKGLVVGQVQSGKTSNFTGLICKAADAGFNLIIVFAGILDDLRSQTQNRLDKGFLGFSTSDINNIRTSRDKIGVGFIDNSVIAHSLTTVLSDFRVQTANAIGVNFQTTDPILFVVKKNGRIMNNLYNWLQQRNTDMKSVLIIDDEADNASINTNKEDFEPTAINRNIRNILSLFKRSAYVGYTATPFANIFISPREEDDLFPRDFIINIPTPPHYIGPEKVFGTSIIPDENNDDLLPIVFPISDYRNFVPEKHKIDEADDITFSDIPHSLKTAIKCFVITCAIRIARNQESEHNSMLIHISRFKAWQNRIKELVEQLFNYYKQEIEANDPNIYEEFRKILEEDTANYKSYTTITTEIQNSSFTAINNDIYVHSWESVKPLLHRAVQKIEIKALNGSSGDSLTYDRHPDGYSVIAIGGNKLSRGLTLEGLSISYFLRASKMYDTLMQMGRWFGYRPGYVDLCRLFTSEELNSWFRHITIASEELRAEFNYLAESGGTPDNYALKVRTSPGLLITSPLKMREATDIQISWAGRLIETYALPRDKGSKKSNLVETDKFIASLGSPKQIDNDFLWQNVSPQAICNYLAKFKIADSMKKKVDLDLIIQYIQNLESNLGELKSWRVVLVNISDKKKKSNHTFSNGITVNCGFRTRSTDSGTDNETYYIKKNHILGGQQEEFIDLKEDNYRTTDSKLLDVALEETQKRKALAKLKKDWEQLSEIEQKENIERFYSEWDTFREDEKQKYWDKKYPAPEIVRQEFRPKTNPLLIIYPLNPKYSNVLDSQGNEVAGTTIYDINDDPFIGFAISFPNSNNTEGMTYRVNKVAEFAETEDLFNSQDDNTYDEQ